MSVILVTYDRLLFSLLKMIDVKFPLQPHQHYYITQHGELHFSYLTQTKDDYTTSSRYIAWENVLHTKKRVSVFLMSFNFAKYY